MRPLKLFLYGAWYVLWTLPIVVFALAMLICIGMRNGPRAAIEFGEDHF